MKKVISIALLFIVGFTVKAQNCSVALSHSVNSSNPAIIDFTLSGSSNPYIPGHQHRYILDYGVGTPDTFLVHPNFSTVNISKTYANIGSYSAQLTIQLVDSAANNVLCTAIDLDSFLISSTTISCNADFYYLLQSSGSLTVDFQDQSITSAGNRIFEWTFGDGNLGSSANPTHTYTTAGTYFVQIKVILMQNGVLQCVDSIVKPVRVGAMDSCNAYFTHYQSNGNVKETNFQNSGQAGSVTTHNSIKSYEWYFGDGSSSSQKNPIHTYSQFGSYQVTSIIYGRDSLTQAIFCTDTFVKTINVNYPTPNCRAYYFLDSMNSSATNVNIYNNSTPTPSHPNYTVSYQWDFGDGSTSNQAFPVHTFQSSGTYNVCVMVSVIDSNSQTCTDTYCRQIGVDSLGDIIYKNSSTGFTLNVLDPNTVGQEEYEELNVKVYPNPASNYVNVEGLKEGAEWSLYNIQGAQIATGHMEASDSKIDFGYKKQGLYVLTLKSGNTIKSIKLSLN